MCFITGFDLELRMTTEGSMFHQSVALIIVPVSTNYLPRFYLNYVNHSSTLQALTWDWVTAGSPTLPPQSKHLLFIGLTCWWLLFSPTTVLFQSTGAEEYSCSVLLQLRVPTVSACSPCLPHTGLPLRAALHGFLQALILDWVWHKRNQSCRVSILSHTCQASLLLQAALPQPCHPFLVGRYGWVLLPNHIASSEHFDTVSTGF